MKKKNTTNFLTFVPFFPQMNADPDSQSWLKRNSGKNLFFGSNHPILTHINTIYTVPTVVGDWIFQTFRIFFDSRPIFIVAACIMIYCMNIFIRVWWRQIKDYLFIYYYSSDYFLFLI